MKISLITRTPDEKIKDLEVPPSSSIRSIQKQLGLNNQVFVVKLNGRIAHPEISLKEGDAVEFIGVIYGG